MSGGPFAIDRETESNLYGYVFGIPNEETHHHRITNHKNGSSFEEN